MKNLKPHEFYGRVPAKPNRTLEAIPTGGHRAIRCKSSQAAGFPLLSLAQNTVRNRTFASSNHTQKIYSQSLIKTSGGKNL